MVTLLLALSVLHACAEPFVNRLFVKHLTVAEAWQEVCFRETGKLFVTTLSTNVL